MLSLVLLQMLMISNCASGLTQKSSLSPFLKIYQTKTLRIYVLKQMDILNLSKIQELQIITLNQK